ALGRRMGKEPVGCGPGKNQTPTRSAKISNLRLVCEQGMGARKSGRFLRYFCGPGLSCQASDNGTDQKGSQRIGTKGSVLIWVCLLCPFGASSIRAVVWKTKQKQP